MDTIAIEFLSSREICCNILIDGKQERPVSGAFKGRSMSGALRRKLTKNSRAIAAQVH
jgi:hypothetical protein